MKAIHFGAGNIGRGFIGQILHLNKFELIFIDTNEDVIRQINKNNSYRIEYIDENKSSYIIDNVRALHAIYDSEVVKDALIEADIITTSVGVANLKYIAPYLKAALLERVKNNGNINILANENMINASNALKEEIKKHVLVTNGIALIAFLILLIRQ